MMKRIQVVCLVLGVVSGIIPQAESQSQPLNIFVVRGTIYAADGVTPAGDGFVVLVENVTKGRRLEDTTGSSAGPSQYVTTFVDFDAPVAAEGDVIRVTVAQGVGNVIAAEEITITSTDIESRFMVVDLRFIDGQGEGGFVFAVRGEVFLSDGAPAGNGLRVVVENLTKGTQQTDLTGAFAGPSGYVTTFVNTDAPVAEIGDVIEVRVESDSGIALGRASETLSEAAIRAGLQKIDVTLTEAQTGLNVFAVRGTVFNPDGVTPAGDGLRVTIENLTRGLVQTDITGRFGGPGQYVTTFLDTENPVADVGDRIAMRVENAAGVQLGEVEIVLSREVVRAGFAVINIFLLSTGGVQVFGVRGTIFAYDDVTPAGNGLRVTVINSNKGLTGTDTTGAAAGDSRYTVTFVSTDAVVAEVGDVLEVQVQDGKTSLSLGRATQVVTDADIAGSFAVVDVILPPFPWDVNGDRVVNIFDLALVGSRFGQSIPQPSPPPNPDVNRDGVVNIFDLVIIAAHFAESYGAPAAAPQATGQGEPALLSFRLTQTESRQYQLALVAESVADLSGVQFDLAFQPDAIEMTAVVPGALLQNEKTPFYWRPPTWDAHNGKVSGIAAARLGTSGVYGEGTLALINFRLKTPSDRGSKEALPTLENLLLVDSEGRLMPVRLARPVTVEQIGATPRQTRLLRNYPNPFNPETWIPYHLAEASAATIEIYDIGGTRVRTIDLGFQSAGIYETRGRAAFWDGKNDNGEPVASGTYFYHFRAGDYRATRKMLMLK